MAANGERFKALRKRRGFTQQGLASVVGVSRQTIDNIERLGSQPRAPLAVALARTLRTTTEKLFG